MNYNTQKIDNLKQFKGVDDPTHFTIELRPTTKCNYDCFYCTDLHINENKIIPLSESNMQKMILYIKKYTGKDVQVFICGGEPTVYTKLTSLINSITEVMGKNDYVEIQTNLGLREKKLLLHINEIKNKELLKISVSYHNTMCKNHLTFIKKCMILKNYGLLNMISYGYNSRKNVLHDYNTGKKIIGSEHCEIVPLINASVDQDPNKGNETFKEIDILNEKEKTILWNKDGHFFDNQLQYTKEDGSVIKTSRNEMWLKRNNNFLGTKCSIPKWKVYVDWNGDVYKCFNQQFSTIRPQFNLNNNVKEEYFKNLSCMDCPFTTCFFDMEYKKTSQQKEVEEVKIDRFFNTQKYKLLKTNIKI